MQHFFVRNREQLANPPVSLAFDGATIERLTMLVSTWALAGLAASRGMDSFGGFPRPDKLGLVCGLQPSRMGRESPVKFVVNARADDILRQRDSTGSADRTGELGINEEIFGFGCPIVSKGELNSRASSPASHHVAG